MERKIVSWLRKKLKASGARGFVVGLSGGVDSAVTAALIKKAVGKNALALIMPCESAAADKKDAVFLAKQLGMPYKIVRLDGVYREFKKAVGKTKNKIALANIKPRLRMAVLYFFANANNCLVCGTSNKTELKLGYFTKFGDGASDIIPLGNLTKNEVIDLAKKLKIPKKIVEKPPSAGLWKGQTDEKEIGAPYKLLDEIAIRPGAVKKLTPPKRRKILKLLANAKQKLAPAEIFKQA
ncbi:MAG: NAD(+) synthase [Elusimicrobia bacterium]|nr:NAD(+) synthase [Elusimicrobiota bacterium]